MPDFWRQLLSFLYPPHCPGCHVAVSRHGEWCRHCRDEVWQPRQLAGSHHGKLTGCYACTDYRGGVRSALLRYKFGRKHLDPLVFQNLLRDFPWPDAFPDDALCVPIPLSRERYAERGFNQVAEIFAPLARERGWQWSKDLVKIRHTPAQSTLSRTDRHTNIKNSFQWEGVPLTGRTVILVDDIYTTGATLEEAARVLYRAGAAQIIGWVIASGAR